MQLLYTTVLGEVLLAVTGAEEVHSNGDDQTYGPIDLGGLFPYYDQQYSSFYVRISSSI